MYENNLYVLKAADILTSISQLHSILDKLR